MRPTTGDRGMRRRDTPTGLEFSGLAPGEFEALCFQLVRIDHEGVERLRAPDAGADVLLRHAAGDRAWQVKRFTGAIHWRQAEASLDAAARRFRLVEYIFCFSNDLT